MFFTFLLGLTAFVIAASAAFFSVYGLVHIYTGLMIPIIIMGAALEGGKLIAASFLYRHWKQLGFAIKTYLFAAIILLMTITSLGIFGYLTASYQTDSIPLKEIETSITNDKTEKQRLLDRNDEINKEIAGLKNNIVNGRIRLQEQRKPEIDANNKRIKELDDEIAAAESKRLNTEAHVGPIIFVAKALGRQPDEAVFWFTLLIMSVFDPLAVALTLATNISAKHHKEEAKPVKDYDKIQRELKRISETSTPIPTLEPTPTPEPPESEIASESEPEPLPPAPPVTVTVTETIKETVDHTQNVEDIVKHVVSEKLDAEAKRRALLAATRK